MDTDYIWLILISLLSVNTTIFIFVLLKKIVMNRVKKRKAMIRKAYEDEFVRYISSTSDEIGIEPKSYLEKKVCKALIIDYKAYIPEEKWDALFNRIGKNETRIKIRRDLLSSNLWKKKTATYLAGEYKLQSLEPLLLEQLKTADTQLFFVTAKSLIKISGKKQLRDILLKNSEGKRLGKNQVLSLLELVEEEIQDILEEIMLSDDLFLKAIALEELGERQYSSSVKWVRASALHPEKEIRIAALKASYKIGDSGDDLYLNDILSMNEDSEWEVRAFLAKFLRKINTEESTEILITYMSDENWYVRRNAADSLHAQGARGLVALNQLLKSDDRFARDAAGAVLQRVALNK